MVGWLEGRLVPYCLPPMTTVRCTLTWRKATYCPVSCPFLTWTRWYSSRPCSSAAPSIIPSRPIPTPHRPRQKAPTVPDHSIGCPLPLFPRTLAFSTSSIHSLPFPVSTDNFHVWQINKGLMIIVNLFYRRLCQPDEFGVSVVLPPKLIKASRTRWLFSFSSTCLLYKLA